MVVGADHMKRNVVIQLATAAYICATGSSAQAHHSYGTFYDLCTTVTVEGQVVNVKWQEPHVLMDLKTNDGTAYVAEWTSPRTLLTTAGLAAGTLKAGDHIAVTGSPLRPLEQIPAAYRPEKRDPALIVVSALTQIRRASDSWSWTRLRESTPPECVQK
jgi:hypothetical protein